MKCLCFNCRGLASASKKLALCRLFESVPFDIILLQETLGLADPIIASLSSIIPGSQFSAMDSTGRLRGLVIGFNSASIKAQASWGGQGFMGLDLFSADLGTCLRVINIYGPCQERESFWNHTLSLSLFTTNNINIGGDLNFSLGYSESWGSMAQVDSITGYTTDLLERHNLIDVPMHKPLPTWKNRRIGEAALARRLDRFTMKGTLIQHMHYYNRWVGTDGISDHYAIYLEILGPHNKPKSPFNFNHGWLQDPSYINMVRDFWTQNPIDRSDSLAKGFCTNLSNLKKLSIVWAREKNRKENTALLNIESELSSLSHERGLRFATAANKSHLVELENQKSKILR